MTAAAPKDPQRTRDLAAIHTAKKTLGLDDDTYRAFLEGLTGKRSAGELDAGERGRVIEALRQRGFARAAGGAKGRADFQYHERPELRLIAALWRAAALLGEVDDPSPRALDAFVQRQAGMAKLQWLPVEKIYAVAQALRSICARGGFVVPADTRGKEKGRAVRIALVKALWAKLEAVGAVSFRNESHRDDALQSYWSRCFAGRTTTLDDAGIDLKRLDRLADALGDWLRRSATRPT